MSEKFIASEDVIHTFAMSPVKAKHFVEGLGLKQQSCAWVTLTLWFRSVATMPSLSKAQASSCKPINTKQREPVFSL